MSYETMTEDCATYVVVRRSESGEVVDKKTCFSSVQEARAVIQLREKWEDPDQYEIEVTK